MEADWSIAIGHPYEGTEAFVADATRAGATPAVLKMLIPGTGKNPSNEATMYRTAYRIIDVNGLSVSYREAGP